MLRWFGLGFLLLSLTHCASYTDQMRQIRNDFIGGQYQEALKKIESSPLKESNNNRLLYAMERSMVYDRMGDFKRSQSLLIEADKIADELFTVSVSKTAASFLLSDTVSDYEGEDYEKIAIHTILALSFLEQNKLKQARVEAKKINTKLYEITQKYDEKYANYKSDAFALFLAALIYETQQNWDDAIIDYKKALKLYESSFNRYVVGGVPTELVNSLYRVAKKRRRSNIIAQLKKGYPTWIERYEKQEAKTSKAGHLAIIHEVGHIAVKREKSFLWPIGDQIVRFSFPYIFNRHVDWHNQINGTHVDGKFYSASNLVNMNALAYQNLEDRRGRLVAKSTARLLVKGQLTYQAKRQFGELGGLIANIVSAATETADTRSWTLLPQAFYLTMVRLEPGEYEVEIKSASRISEIRKIQIQDEKLVLLRSKT